MKETPEPVIQQQQDKMGQKKNRFPMKFKLLG